MHLPALLTALLSLVSLSYQRDAALVLTMQSGANIAVCSGSAIGPHTLITATHCIAGQTLLTVDGKPVKTVGRMDDGADHTILRVDATFRSTVPMCGRPPIQGEAVVWFGNPAGATDLMRRGYIAGFVNGMIVVDAQIYSGDSGSAVLSASGCVLGIISQRKNVPDGSFEVAILFPLAFTAAQLERASH